MVREGEMHDVFSQKGARPDSKADCRARQRLGNFIQCDGKPE